MTTRTITARSPHFNVPSNDVLSSLINQAGERRKELVKVKRRFTDITEQQNAILEQYASGKAPDAFPSDDAADRQRDVVDAMEAVLSAAKNAEKAQFVVERNLVTLLGYSYGIDQD